MFVILVTTKVYYQHFQTFFSTQNKYYTWYWYTVYGWSPLSFHIVEEFL